MKNLQLFDVNASIGKGAYEVPDFPDAKSLIDHMDYLGIERTLVWHYEARDTNPTWGNKNLLQEISSSSDFQKRLIPAFTITPACFYEKGTLAFLKENMAAGKTRALRIFPDASRFSVRHLEQLLRELLDFQPVVFCDCRSFGGEFLHFRDIGELALKYPATRFVITQKMWGGFGNIMDLMWRAKNVYADISWVHMRENIELMVNNFGADRVLFGTGFKAHYGAAIASLAHANISDEVREQIAHKNVEKILGLDAAPFTVDGDVKDKPLWDKFRNGKGLDIGVIDAHGHIGPSTRGWFLPENDYETQLEKLVARMDKLGVAQLYVSGENALFGDCVPGNKIAEEKCKPYKGRIFGYVAYNPLYGEELVKEFDNFFAGGFFKGFKVLASYWKVKVTDPAYTPLLEYADKNSLPILYHTWDDSCNSPAMFADIVKQYPNIRFLLGHSGGGGSGRKEAVALAKENKNVFLEYCGSFTTPIDWLETFREVGFDRVMFGSDTSAHDQAWELGRLLSTPIADEKLMPVLKGNMEKMMGDS